MSAALLILGLALGALAVWLVMRRDDRPGDPVAEARAEAGEIKAEAAEDLAEAVESADRERQALRRATGARSDRERREGLARMANRKRKKT